MSTSVKSTAQKRVIAEFFADVPGVRRYLNRHQQDPSERRERLASLAHQLARPRVAAELTQFLVHGFGMAVGSRGALLLAPAESQALARWGNVEAGPPANVWQEANEAPMAGPPYVKRLDRDLVLALRGSVRVVGLLWLEGVLNLDDACLRLLGALADTAGMHLEIQGIGRTKTPPP